SSSGSGPHSCTSIACGLGHFRSKRSFHSCQSQWVRNFSPALRPEAMRSSSASLERLKSVLLWPEVSTKIVRSVTEGSSMCLRSWALIIVDSSDRAYWNVVVLGRHCAAGVCRAESMTTNVGHRAGLASLRSKTSTGKFESRPPSAPSTEEPPADFGRAGRDRGRKKKGLAAEAHTASATDWLSASTPRESS